MVFKNPRYKTSSGVPAFNLRMPLDLRRQLADIAETNGRSLNAEIVQRLRASLETYRKF